MDTRKAQAVHDLICAMLRGQHLRQIAGADLAHYTNKAGLALHNLPMWIIQENAPLDIPQLQDIDELDPDGGNGQWGPWVSKLCGDIGQPLPPYQAPGLDR